MMTTTLRLSLGIAAATMLIGCSKADTADANTANVAVANEAAPVVETAAPAAAPAAAAATGDALSTDYMVGKWSAMAEDCKDTIEFRKDGSMVTPIGNAKWGLNGDKLMVDFGDGRKQEPSSIKVLTHERIEITKAGGKTENQKRC